MIRLIGLAGPAHVGKTSAAGFVNDCLGFEEYSLSDPIKSCMNALFGWDYRHSDGPLKEVIAEVKPDRPAYYDAWEESGLTEFLGKPNGAEVLKLLGLNDSDMLSPRHAYQLFGTEFGRAKRPTIWLDLAKAKLDAMADDEGMVISDIRFPNEHRWVSYSGGFVIHVRREGGEHGIVSDHASEQGLERMAVDWQTPFCKDLAMLEDAIAKACQFAEFSSTSDVRITGRMKTFEQAYGDRL